MDVDSVSQDPVAVSSTPRRALPWFLGGVGVTLCITMALLLFVSSTRERIADDAIRANMESIAIQANWYRQTVHGYVHEEGSVDCYGGVFTDPTIQAALVAIRLSNGNHLPSCRADTTTFAMVVPRPSRGVFIPNTPFWCVDASSSVCEVADAHHALSNGCNCSLP